MKTDIMYLYPLPTQIYTTSAWC